MLLDAWESVSEEEKFSKINRQQPKVTPSRLGARMHLESSS
jgi:hypothetical protein